MSRLTNCAIPVVIAGLIAGCGVKKEIHQKALDDLAATQRRLSETESDRNAKNKRVKELEGELSTATASLDQLSAAEREKRERLDKVMKEMEVTEAELVALRKQQEQSKKAFRQLTERFRALVDTGKLQVEFRKGQMVLKLPSGVLFDSGKSELSKAGEAALTEVLDILKEFKDRRFLIAGHTDNVPVRSSRYKNNWQLSTARAVSVLEFMIEAGFEPKNLGAAGYGEFDPVAPNDTADNRQLNRRIEIILVPDLSELPNLKVDAPT